MIEKSPTGAGRNSGNPNLNMQSNIETPSAVKPKESLVTLTITSSYISGASRDRTGDLWLAKPLPKSPNPANLA